MPNEPSRLQPLPRSLDSLNNRREQLRILSTLDEDNTVEVVAGLEFGEDEEECFDVGRKSRRIEGGGCEEWRKARVESSEERLVRASCLVRCVVSEEPRTLVRE